jgi:hypothetical protein
VGVASLSLSLSLSLLFFYFSLLILLFVYVCMCICVCIERFTTSEFIGFSFVISVMIPVWFIGAPVSYTQYFLSSFSTC